MASKQKKINKWNCFHLFSFHLKNSKCATSDKSNYENVSTKILKQSGSLKLLSANHCSRISGKLIKSIFLGHIPELMGSKFLGWGLESEFLTSSPGNNPDAHSSLRTNHLDAGGVKSGAGPPASYLSTKPRLVSSQGSQPTRIKHN